MGVKAKGNGTPHSSSGSDVLMAESSTPSQTDLFSSSQPSSIESIIFQAYDPPVPESNEEWESILSEATNKSELRLISLKDHNSVWMMLIESVYLTESPKENLVLCCTKAVKNMPIPSTPKDGEVAGWKMFLEIVYNKLFNGELDMDEAAPMTEAVNQKFGCSPLLSHTYWSMRKAFLTKYGLSRGLSKEDINKQIIEMHMEQFAHPYLKIDHDWYNVQKWLKKEKIDQEIKTAIQLKYYSVTVESQKLCQIYEQKHDTCQHPTFHDYVKQLISREITDDCKISQKDVENSILTTIEEVLTNQQQNLCNYVVYLLTLNDVLLQDKPYKNKLLKNVIHRALLHGKKFCTQNVFTLFVETIFLVALNNLDVPDVTGLMRKIIEEVTVHHSVNVWFTSRRAVLACARHLMIAGQINIPEFDEFFKQTIHPFTMDFFLKNTVPTEFSKTLDYEPKLMDLFKTWMSTINEVEHVTWERELEKWNDAFAHNDNPIMLVALAKFIRQNGSIADAEQIFKTVLQRLQDLNKVNSTSTSRKCHIQLLMDWQTLKMRKGCAEEQLKLTQDLFSAHSSYSTAYNETYELYYTDDDMLTTVFADSLMLGLLSPPPKEQVHEMLRAKMESELTIKSSGLSQWTFRSSEDGTVAGDSTGQPLQPLTVDALNHPLFVSNLSFKASENDIIRAFDERGIQIVGVDLKKNHKGHHLGFGTLYLKSKDDVDLSVATMDRIEIAGRQAYLSYYKCEKQQKPQPKEGDKLPTLLVISDLPSEWQNPQKIENALAPYGHIKSISVEDKSEPVTIRVEFHMAGDAANAYEQWQQGLVFKDVALTIRKGFVSMKQLRLVNKNKGNKHKGAGAHTKSDQGPSASSAHFPIGPFLPAWPAPQQQSRTTLPFAFIPQQVVRSSTSMKKKLEMPENIQEIPKPKKLKVEEREQEIEPSTDKEQDEDALHTEQSPPLKKKK